MVSSEIKSSFPMMRDSTMGNGALAENLKEDDKTVIWRPHEEKYRTSEWYTGSGQITTGEEGLSFEVTAVYQLKSEVKVVKDIFALSNHTLANIYRPRSRCVAVVDQTVAQLYGEKIEGYFQAQEIPLELMVVRAWESDKTPETVHRILAFLGKDGCDVSRNEPVLVIGGGVLSDVAGLACALQHRRTPYIMIGTTIIAAIDAGPSPRTCTNGTQFKNSIGVYHPPVLTLVDRQFFATLDMGHIRNGMAEIIKMAVTDDKELFELLEDYGQELIRTRFATVDASEELEKIADLMIYKALYAYMKHEGTNMFETYQDRPHAYGHTWSPRFEPAVKLMHGHAVTIGMAFGATLAQELGWLSQEECQRIINLSSKLGLSVFHPILEDTQIMVDGQKNMRRKRGDGGLWAPLPTTIGACDYVQEVEPDLLNQAVVAHKKYCSQLPNQGAGEQMYLRDLGLE